MRTFRKTAQAVMGLSVALLAGNALAAIPAPLVGTYLTYTFNTDPGVFGVASLDVDESGLEYLVFAPTAAFEAVSANGLPGFKNQNLVVTVSVNAPYLDSLSLSGFSLAEDGKYSLDGSHAVAGVTGNLTAVDIEGSAASIGGTIVGSGLGVIGGTQNWTASAGVTLPGTGWGGDDGVVSSVKLELTNKLFATTLSGETAKIWKTAASLHVVASPVPEAETYAMMLAGLGLVGFMVRRKRQPAA